VLSTQLVVRASCRCFPRGKKVPVAQAATARQRQGFEAALIERRDLILAEIARSARAGLGAAGPGWEGRLLNGLVGSLRDGSGDEFLKAFDEVLRAAVAAGGEVRVLYNVLLALRGQALAALPPASEQRERAEVLFHEAASIVSEAEARVQAHRRITLKHRARSIAGVVTGFSAWRSRDELARRLADDLATMGVGTCYVATYEPAADRSHAKLFFAYHDQRRRTASEGEERFSAPRLVPDGVTHDRPMGLVLAPLFFNGEDLGFMLIELGKCEASVFYVLPTLVSLALHHARRSDVHD